MAGRGLIPPQIHSSGSLGQNIVWGAQEGVGREPNSCWFSVGNECEHINKGIKSRLREKKGFLYSHSSQSQVGSEGLIQGGNEKPILNGLGWG